MKSKQLVLYLPVEEIKNSFVANAQKFCLSVKTPEYNQSCGRKQTSYIVSSMLWLQLG